MDQHIQETDPDLKDLLDTIDNDFSGFKSRICDTEGNLKGYFNVYIDGEDSRHLEGMQSKFRENSELIIVAAVAGG